MFNSLPEVCEINSRREQILAKNEQMSHSNRELARQAEQLKETLRAKKRTLEEKTAQINEIEARCSALKKDRFSSHLLAGQLAEAAEKCDTESEGLVDDFQAGRIELKEFLTKYTEMRKLYHLRNLKKECLLQGKICLAQPDSNIVSVP